MKVIGIIAHNENPRAAEMLIRLGACAASCGPQLLAWDETAAHLRRLGVPFKAGTPAQADALLVLGGDGTMLRAVRDTVDSARPLIGVNIGGLGFLTSVAQSDLERAVDCLARDAFTTSSRSMAVCSVIRDGLAVSNSVCLNDAVIRNGDSGRIVALEVSVDHGAAASIAADGLIVATPTGSTGHSLSAGGPILHPACPAFVVTFICAHALGARPLVIPDSSVIEVGLVKSTDAIGLIVDGQGGLPLLSGDRVRISKAPNHVIFIHLPGYDYLSLLQQKLRWQGSTLAQSSAV
ncbi:MAG: NAD(+)/NADH kinase [Kiritimatiellia bacterium]